MRSSLEHDRCPFPHSTRVWVVLLLLTAPAWGCGGGESQADRQPEEDGVAAAEGPASFDRDAGAPVVVAGEEAATSVPVTDGSDSEGGRSPVSLDVVGSWRVVELSEYDEEEAVAVDVREGRFHFSGITDCQRRQLGSFSMYGFFDDVSDDEPVSSTGAWCQSEEWLILGFPDSQEELRCLVADGDPGLVLDCRGLDPNAGQVDLADLGSIPTIKDGGFLVRLVPDRL